MSGRPNINTDSVRGLAATYVRAAEQVGQAIPGGRLMSDTIPGLCDEIDHLRQECRDRECTEQDVRARLADAENTLARVAALADDWENFGAGSEPWASSAAHLRAALGGTS